jgi:hypothetical protein
MKNKENIPYVTDNYEMVELLQQYDTINDPEKTCKYCLESLPYHTLVNPCDCTQPVHIHCFKKWFKPTIVKCEICGDNYSKKNEPRMKYNMLENKIESEIFFPFDNYYPTPLMSYNELELMGDDNSYYYALCYLQLNRMRDLLEKDNINVKKKLGVMLGYFRNCSMPSNYLLNGNEDAYNDMAGLLVEYKVVDREFFKLKL